MTWVTLQSHDIGDTFVGIYALEKVFGVGRAGAICPRLRGKSVSWLYRCLRVSRKSAYEGLERYGAGGVQTFRNWSHWPDYSQKRAPDRIDFTRETAGKFGRFQCLCKLDAERMPSPGVKQSSLGART